ncbi:MAG: hypothetical protein GY820_00715 [Gammaproteobacteria bacterium]|nr:hypothetical protein [Gammaproteobacteria bacterium]
MEIGLGLKYIIMFKITVLSIFKCFNRFPMGLILLKVDHSQLDASESELLTSMKLSYVDSSRHTQHREIVQVTEPMTKFISDHLHDIVIYSRRSVFNRCTFFSDILRSHADPEADYELRPGREWDRIGHEDLSLNRCPEEGESRKPFVFTRFKLGKPTPGKRNDCSGPHYILEERIPSIGAEAMETPIETPEECQPSTSTQSLSMRSERVVSDRDAQVSVSRQLTSPSVCPAVEELPEDVLKKQQESVRLDNAIVQLEAVHQLVEKMWVKMADDQPTEEPASKKKKIPEAESEIPQKPWEDTSLFKKEWLTLIKRHQSEYIKPEKIGSELKTWLVYHFNEDEPDKSKFGCRFCTKRASEGRIDSRHMSPLATAEGFFTDNGKLLNRRIMEHSKSTIHLSAIQEMKESFKSNLETYITQFRQAEHEKVAALQSATERMIRTIYTEVQTNIPFDSHRFIVSLQKLNGIDMGVHHYERRSATRMVEAISRTMHTTLIEHITSTNDPLSLIVDCSTDASQKNYLIVSKLKRTIIQGYTSISLFICHLRQQKA